MGGTLSPLEALVRLALALLLGTVVGIERERGERAAGMRTHALVCLGSALMMLVSAYGLEGVANGSSVIVDPSRIAAQVVSGIGFLGAGTIIFRREVVRGLTTAAGLWVVAGIGLASGAGLYFAAVAGTVGALVILAALRPIEWRLFQRPEPIVLRVRPTGGQIEAIRHACERSGVHLRRMTLHEGRTGGEEAITLHYYPARPENVERLVELLRETPGFAALTSATVQLGAPSEAEQERAEIGAHGKDDAAPRLR